MPAGAVEQQDGVSAARNAARDFVDVLLHRLGVGIGQGESRPFAARRADGAKQIEVFITLVRGLARARSPPRPLTNLAVLLADARFVLKPDLDRLVLWNVGEMRAQRGREVFLNAAMVSGFWPGWRGRALMWEKPICFNILPTVRG